MTLKLIKNIYITLRLIILKCDIANNLMQNNNTIVEDQSIKLGFKHKKKIETMNRTTLL